MEGELPDFSVHRASELGTDEKLLLERWLGRPLDADETISVNAWRPHTAPCGDRLETLRRDLLAQARAIGSRAPEMAAAERDELIADAQTEVRRMPR
jgi:hypothetical protein